MREFNSDSPLATYHYDMHRLRAGIVMNGLVQVLSWAYIVYEVYDSCSDFEIGLGVEFTYTRVTEALDGQCTFETGS
ncbi:hypothetical protein IMZ48_26460 [Candidatus Bathyarchaeota archaeon]|nr:hypothetical protein [Candidatus Bathyarchaeota archaeon]